MTPDAIRAAATVIAPYASVTPVLTSRTLDERCGCASYDSAFEPE